MFSNILYPWHVLHGVVFLNLIDADVGVVAGGGTAGTEVSSWGEE
jgi:hypothetical protein